MTIPTGVVVAVIATFVPLPELAELVDIGTLFAFVLVAIGVLALGLVMYFAHGVRHGTLARGDAGSGKA